MKRFMKKRLLFSVLIAFCGTAIFAQTKGTDSVSENSIASVVKLSSYFKVYEVEGLSDDYEYSESDGEPDFKGGKLIRTVPVFLHVGTGVIVTKNGMILSNAHVTGAYKNVIIEEKKNPQGKSVFGSDGKAVKYVEVPVLPGYMFADAVDVVSLKKNDDSVSLKFLAKVLVEDENYRNQVRDRAILQITNKILLDENGYPYYDSDGLPKSFPFAQLGNPFENSILDNKVKSLGFPGSGDPNRSAKTSGERLGYESASSSSKILHSSWISGGNSGGGLFYNDKLIGINTWDNQSDSARPVAVAQPVSWWFESFVFVKWFYPDVALPDFSFDWISGDPSTDSYKNNAYVKIQVKQKSNQQLEVNKGQILVYKDEFSLDKIIEYRQYEQFFDTCWKIVQALWNNPVEQVAEYYGVSENFAKNFENVTTTAEMRRLMSEDVLEYYDQWTSGKFIYGLYDFVSDGKMVLTLQKNSKYQLCYIDENGDVQDSYKLTSDKKAEQGPYTVWLY